MSPAHPKRLTRLAKAVWQKMGLRDLRSTPSQPLASCSELSRSLFRISGEDRPNARVIRPGKGQVGISLVPSIHAAHRTDQKLVVALFPVNCGPPNLAHQNACTAM